MQQPEGGSLKEAIRQPEGSNPELVLHPEHPKLTRATLSLSCTLARLGGGRAAAFECPQPFFGSAWQKLPEDPFAN
jgi:hypothetical protein